MTKSALRIGCIIALLFIFGAKAEARQIDTVIIHHSAADATDERDHSAAEIDRWHRERGWSGIGYHYVICKSGDVQSGRSLDKAGAHAKGRNKNSIGICAIGYSEFTLSQKIALASLVRTLCAKYPVMKIERHHEECPGPSLNVEGMAREILDDRIMVGKASYFCDRFTASGENMYLQPWAKTCASWFYPLGSILRVTNTKTGKSVKVRVNDRGPRKDKVAQGRIIDLSPAAFAKLAPLSKGVVDVRVEPLI